MKRNLIMPWKFFSPELCRWRNKQKRSNPDFKVILEEKYGAGEQVQLTWIITDK
jgi:hypothetical protein